MGSPPVAHGSDERSSAAPADAPVASARPERRGSALRLLIGLLAAAARTTRRRNGQQIDEVPVEEVAARGVSVMVGDGINDAPALAAADVGIATGGQAATASADAADIVVPVDRFDRIVEAVAVARRTQAIAWKSIQIGRGLATLAMLLAAVGSLPRSREPSFRRRSTSSPSSRRFGPCAAGARFVPARD